LPPGDTPLGNARDVLSEMTFRVPTPGR
jgi:hypothetical protein